VQIVEAEGQTRQSLLEAEVEVEVEVALSVYVAPLRVSFSPLEALDAEEGPWEVVVLFPYDDPVDVVVVVGQIPILVVVVGQFPILVEEAGRLDPVPTATERRQHEMDQGARELLMLTCLVDVEAACPLAYFATETARGFAGMVAVWVQPLGTV
jgi:hypothetical protein